MEGDLDTIARETARAIADGAIDASDASFDRRALALHRAQLEHVTAYRAWCEHELATRGVDTAGDEALAAAVRSWRDAPALPIAAFRRMRVSGATTDAATFTSSGTTGADRSAHHMGSLATYDASLDAGVRTALLPDVAAGETPPLRCIQLQPDTARAPHSSLTHMFDRIRTGPLCTDGGCFVDAAYVLDAAGAWARLQECAERGEPVLLLATSFALALLLDHVDADPDRERTLVLPPASRIVDTGGYKGRTRELTRSELLARVREHLGVQPEWCENEYGMSELSSQAWLGTIAAATGRPLAADAPGGVRWTPPWLRVRVVDPATLDEVADGEQGLLVFHDLANVWSCGCLRSEDVGIRRGTGFELVGRAPGATLKGCSLQLEDL